jgi:tetratricopeptide (TPR) repeat protein
MNRWSFRPLATALLATLLALPAAAQDWSGKGRLAGTITDEAGKPVAGATIRLRHEKIPDEGPADLKTDKKGKWSYLGLLGGSWTVKVVAEGYAPSEGTVNVNEFAANPPLQLKLHQPTEQELAAVEDPKMKAASEAFDRGMALLQERKAAEARAEFEKALPSFEGVNRRIVLKKIAFCQDAEGNTAAAVETLKTVLAEAPDDVDTIQAIANYLVALKRDAEAAEYLAKLPQGATGADPNTILNMGINLFNENKSDEALAKFEQVISLKPDWGVGYYFRGRVFLVMNRLDEAKTDFRKYLELEPSGQYASECQEFLGSLK